MNSKKIIGLAALVLSGCNNEAEITDPINLFDEDRIEMVDYQDFNQQRKPLTEEDLHDVLLPLPCYTNEIEIAPNFNFLPKNKNLVAYIPPKPLQEKIGALSEEKKVENIKEEACTISPDGDGNQFDLSPNADLLAQLLPKFEKTRRIAVEEGLKIGRQEQITRQLEQITQIPPLLKGDPVKAKYRAMCISKCLDTVCAYEKIGFVRINLGCSMFCRTSYCVH
ncbi:MAG: hypothetical protein ABIG52_00905 [Nanoarchaeota archaeon]